LPEIILLIALFLPLAGALVLPSSGRAARLGALVIALAVLALVADLVARYPAGTAAFAATDFAWLGPMAPSIDVRFSVGLDGLSLWLFALTSLLMVVAILVSWESIRDRASLYYRLLLVLETGMLGVFVARDIILFYVFFEFTLIPLFFVIGIWGGPERRWASMKFFLFTFAGSVLTLLGLLTIVAWCYFHSTDAAPKLTFSIPAVTRALGDHPIERVWQFWIFAALFAGFAIKVPLFPLHTWLPLAHVEAPTAGSVLLAGVLLKLGTYGFARFNLPMLPQATAALMPWLLGISVAGIIYGALVALAQSDIKRLVAYSSVSHLGFCMLGLFALNRPSVAGGVLQMVNHGISTGGLFALVGMIYDRYHTRQIGDFGGLARRLPRLAFFAMLLCLSSIALPGTNGFSGEFLLLLGMFQRGWAEAGAGALPLRIIAVASLAGVVLGAWYILWMYQRVFFGPVHEPHHEPPPSDVSTPTAGNDQSGTSSPPASTAPPVSDLSLREVLTLTPLVVMIFWIGLWPQFFVDRMQPTLDALTAPARAALEVREEGGEGRIAAQKTVVLNGSGFNVQGSISARSISNSEAQISRDFSIVIGMTAKARRSEIAKTGE
jgi:NADH-quinone oxidoreductase subunit M